MGGNRVTCRDVLGGMHAILRPTVLAWFTASVLAACSVAGASPTASLPDNPPASVPIVDSGGTGDLPAPGPTGGALPPATPTLVVPRPGRLHTHPVGVTGLEAHVEGAHEIVQLSWWSGVAPCTVLDSVDVKRAGDTFTLTVREGADQLDVACIAIAQYKGTVLDLGPLALGTYTISAFGEAPPVTVTVR